MTCITFASLIFAFSPIIPADPTIRPRVRSFVSVLRAALLVFKRFIPFAQIDGIDLPIRCRFHFRYFAFLTSCSSQYSAMTRGIHQRSVDVISGM